MGTYNNTFKSVFFESVKVKSVKINFFSKALGWSKKSFVRRFENDTFESVFFKSVEIESVVVSAQPHSPHLSMTKCGLSHFQLHYTQMS